MRNRILSILIIVVVAVVCFAILYPATNRAVDPAWAQEAFAYLSDIGAGLRDYAKDNQGRLPDSLSQLYPRYVQDVRIKQPYVDMGPKMVLIYYKPLRLGSAQTPVAEIRLWPTEKTRISGRGFVLWGDLRVRMDQPNR